MQELAKIFLSLPGAGEKKAIRCKEITDNVPDILNVFPRPANERTLPRFESHAIYARKRVRIKNPRK